MRKKLLLFLIFYTSYLIGKSQDTMDYRLTINEEDIFKIPLDTLVTYYGKKKIRIYNIKWYNKKDSSILENTSYKILSKSHLSTYGEFSRGIPSGQFFTFYLNKYLYIEEYDTEGHGLLKSEGFAAYTKKREIVKYEGRRPIKWTFYEYGNRIGKWVFYEYEKGFVQIPTIKYYSNGKLNGPVIKYDKNLFPKHIEIYKNGKKEYDYDLGYGEQNQITAISP